MNATRAPSSHLVRLAAAVLLALSLGACNRGLECDECDDDNDCVSGRTCAEFEGGYRFCADDDTDSCTVSY